MSKESQLTFTDLVGNLSFIQVIWNGIVVFDDKNREESIDTLKQFELDYGNRKVYNMIIKVVFGHHCMIDVVGEE